MISYLLVVEQHRTQIVIHALLKCQQENLYHEQNVTHIRSEERFSRNAETDLVCRLLLEKKKRGDPALPMSHTRTPLQPRAYTHSSCLSSRLLSHLSFSPLRSSCLHR